MQKGGVGKSTTTINLSGALSDAGHDVLLVDADPQGFSTVTLGFKDYYVDPDAKTLYHVLREDADQFHQVNEFILEHDEFDLLPAHGRNFNLEKELYSLSRTQERLGMVLDEVEEDYDFVLIDSPPNLGPLADGAILGAKNVLFVSKPDQIATFSLELLLEEIRSIEKNFVVDIDTIGAVVNDLQDNQITEDRLEWFQSNVGEDNTFIVPSTVAIEGAFGQQHSVFDYEAENRHREQKAAEVKDIYHNLAMHVEELA